MANPLVPYKDDPFSCVMCQATGLVSVEVRRSNNHTAYRIISVIFLQF